MEYRIYNDCHHEFIVMDSQWKKCKLCGQIKPVMDFS